jgi:hypothetical protein
MEDLLVKALWVSDLRTNVKRGIIFNIFNDLLDNRDNSPLTKVKEYPVWNSTGLRRERRKTLLQVP